MVSFCDSSFHPPFILFHSFHFINPDIFQASHPFDPPAS
jgi:hypothetical protein